MRLQSRFKDEQMRLLTKVVSRICCLEETKTQRHPFLRFFLANSSLESCAVLRFRLVALPAPQVVGLICKSSIRLPLPFPVHSLLLLLHLLLTLGQRCGELGVGCTEGSIEASLISPLPVVLHMGAHVVAH